MRKPLELLRIGIDVKFEPFNNGKGLPKALYTQIQKSYAMPISRTMVSTLCSGGLGGLLRAVKSGTGALGRCGGPVIDSDTSSNEEEVGDGVSNFENGGVTNIGGDNNIVSTPGWSTINTMVATRNNNSLTGDRTVEPT